MNKSIGHKQYDKLVKQFGKKVPEFGSLFDGGEIDSLVASRKLIDLVNKDPRLKKGKTVLQKIKWFFES